MCGIAGIINFNSQSVNIASIDSMIKLMHHRGPDSNGKYIDSNIGFGFARLAIIDLNEESNQPMIIENGNLVIVYNGEIFNYIEIKQELELLGHSFKTKSDTEVVLRSYIHWGEECLHKFNGMWAFAIYNKKENRVFISRDRFGIKPLYYFHNNDSLIFCSEIKPILSILNNKPEINENAIFNYLVFNRTDLDDTTFFKNIKKLMHGHTFTIENSQVKLKRWYNLKERLAKPFNSPEEYKNLLKNSIEIRLRSDVPLGVCFSGGLDSSSIVSLINELEHDITLNTFSAVYNRGDIGDESKYIELYKEKVKNLHLISPSFNGLIKDLNDFIKTHQEPVPSSSIYAQYKVMELAKNHVKVTLDGQGADESLGGYHYFFGIYFKELLLKFKWLTLIRELIKYRKINRSWYGIKTFFFFLFPSKLKTNIRIKSINYLTNTFIKDNVKSSNVSESLYSSKSLKDALIDHFEHKLEHLLKWEDANSMRFSIEARVPFLDHRIVERTLSLNPEDLINNGYTKNILRKAMIGIVPNDIIWRADKIGFETPASNWFKTDELKKNIYGILNSSEFKSRNIIDPEKAIKMYSKHLNGEIDLSQDIWKWINLELWFRNYID
jgi:asparagine synthase (glutamine-hydrolysing)